MDGMLPTLPFDDRPEARKHNARDILARVLDGHAPAKDEAEYLLGLQTDDDLRRLQETADALRRRQAGDEVPFAAQQSIYLTNQCELEHTLYDYARPPGSLGALTLTVDDIDERLDLAAARGADQIYVSIGGFSSLLTVPGLESGTLLKTLGRLLEHIRDRKPETPVVGFSPDEVEFLRIVSDRSHRYVLEFLKDKGVRMLGGHHGEILHDDVRRKISPRLSRVKTWIEVVESAASLQLPVIAAIGYGHFESPRQRIEHLDILRSIQHKHPGVFPMLAVEPLPRPVDGLSLKTPNPAERRKMQAVCRLFAGESIPQQQVGWMLHDGALAEAQELLSWGASHFGTTDALAWATFRSGGREAGMPSAGEMQSLIVEAGRSPKRQPFAFGI